MPRISERFPPPQLFPLCPASQGSPLWTFTWLLYDHLSLYGSWWDMLKWVFSGQICVCTDTCAKFVSEKQNGGWFLLECNFPPSLQDIIIIWNLRTSSGTYAVSSVFLIWLTECTVKPKNFQWHFVCCRLASVLGNLARHLFSCYTPRSFSS